METSITIHTKHMGVEKAEVFEKMTAHLYVSDRNATCSKEVALVEDCAIAPVVIGVIDCSLFGYLRPYRAYRKEDEEIMRDEIPIRAGFSAAVLEHRYPGELKTIHDALHVSM